MFLSNLSEPFWWENWPHCAVDYLFILTLRSLKVSKIPYHFTHKESLCAQFVKCFKVPGHDFNLIFFWPYIIRILKIKLWHVKLIIKVKLSPYMPLRYPSSQQACDTVINNKNVTRIVCHFFFCTSIWLRFLTRLLPAV